MKFEDASPSKKGEEKGMNLTKTFEILDPLLLCLICQVRIC
jgi:hypothetical protein